MQSRTKNVLSSPCVNKQPSRIHSFLLLLASLKKPTIFSKEAGGNCFKSNAVFINRERKNCAKKNEEVHFGDDDGGGGGVAGDLLGPSGYE